MLINFVNAINAVRGPVWLVMVGTLAMLLLFARYYKQTPSGNLIDSLNSIHPAVYGFILCMMGVILELNGHENAGDKVFLSGASFIGGVAATKFLASTASPNVATAQAQNPS